MKTINISEATNIQIDYLVAKVLGQNVRIQGTTRKYLVFGLTDAEGTARFRPSTSYDQGMPILEREGVAILKISSGEWAACIETGQQATRHSEFNDGYPFYFFERDEMVVGPTILIAGLRCYLVSKLGETAEVPEELA